MNNHLSQEQFANCFVGLAANTDRQHLIECAECRVELEGFGNTISSLRQAIHGRVEAQAESRPAAAVPFSIQPATQGIQKMRWALATAAVLILGMLPLLTSEKPEAVPVANATMPVETSPEALMDAINAHLSRTVPAPMEPMMSLIPSDEPRTE